MPFNCWFIGAKLQWGGSVCHFSIFGWAIQSPRTYFLFGLADTALHQVAREDRCSLELCRRMLLQVCSKLVFFLSILLLYQLYLCSYTHTEPWHSQEKTHCSRSALPLAFCCRQEDQWSCFSNRLLQIQSVVCWKQCGPEESMKSRKYQLLQFYVEISILPSTSGLITEVYRYGFLMYCAGGRGRDRKLSDLQENN